MPIKRELNCAKCSNVIFNEISMIKYSQIWCRRHWIISPPDNKPNRLISPKMAGPRWAYYPMSTVFGELWYGDNGSQS